MRCVWQSAETTCFQYNLRCFGVNYDVLRITPFLCYLLSLKLASVLSYYAFPSLDPGRAENPEDCDKYFDENDFLKPYLYFNDFAASVHSIISTLVLPKEFTMLPLTTSFMPCTRCMTTKHKGLQVMRCRHKADCEQHKRCRCEEPSKCKCLDECGCREYASPSLTWSKVGLVLHLQWRGEDGTLSTMDIDLNCPTWPTHTRFSGSTTNAENYLMSKRPVGWLEEHSKLEDFEAAADSPHLLISKNWPVKFRLINRDTVLPSQVTTLTPPLSSPDSSFHERQGTEREQVTGLCNLENTQILHWYESDSFSRCRPTKAFLGEQLQTNCKFQTYY